MRCLFRFCAALVLSATILLSASHAQEGTWSVSGAAGIGVLSMGTVNDLLDRTVLLWNEFEFVPIGRFEHFSTTPLFSGRVLYRYERDYAISLSLQHFNKTVRNNYHDAVTSVTLERSIGSTDIVAGVTYFTPPLFFVVEPFISLEGGMIFSRASAKTYATRTRKVEDSTETLVFYDTKARYKKSKLILVATVGATMSLNDWAFVRIDGTYKFAKVGKLDGTIERIYATFEEQTTVDFDFSLFSINVGFGVVF